ncbi:hypothetical protein [Catenulispora rubra]|uniref:hypothetical protein n=1 Tax=Catenulispora rubra TaxID=280293 RepID=UPI00189201F8|nr:hypothetical protein [Catenulispora rubra]
MRIANSKEFDTWFDALIAAAAEGDQLSSVKLGLVAAELAVLRALDGPPMPEEETADLKRVRQSGKYTVWRVSHPYQPGVAIRLICWFPPDTKIVVAALSAGDKGRIGDVWYNSVGPRADAIIEQWKREVRYDREA